MSANGNALPVSDLDWRDPELEEDAETNFSRESANKAMELDAAAAAAAHDAEMATTQEVDSDGELVTPKKKVCVRLLHNLLLS